MNKEVKDIEFNSVLDLYNRVKPALRTKLKELKRENLDYIKEEDIWNYLIKTKWSNASGLVLCDFVDYILHTDNEKIYKYLKEEHKKRQDELLFEELDLI